VKEWTNGSRLWTEGLFTKVAAACRSVRGLRRGGLPQYRRTRRGMPARLPVVVRVKRKRELDPVDTICAFPHPPERNLRLLLLSSHLASSESDAFGVCACVYLLLASSRRLICLAHVC
jgi:hypothetical protein